MIIPGATPNPNFGKFEMTVTEAPGALANARERVVEEAAMTGAKLIDWQVTPFVLESNPPQAIATGKLVGDPMGVAAALTAIQDLDAAI